MKHHKNICVSLSIVSAMLLMVGCSKDKPEESTDTDNQAQVPAPAASAEPAPVSSNAKPAFAIFSFDTGMIDILMKPESAPADISIKNICPAGSQPFGLADLEFGGKLYCNDTTSRSISVMDLASKAELFTWSWPASVQGMPTWAIGRWNKGTDVGLTAYDSGAGVFHIYDSAEKSFVLRGSFEYGGTDPSLSPLVGDWDGDGADSVGVYRSSSQQMDLRNALDAGIADISFRFVEKSAEPQDLAVTVNTEKGSLAALYSDSKGAVTTGSSDPATRPQTVFLFGAPEQKKSVVPVR